MGRRSEVDVAADSTDAIAWQTAVLLELRAIRAALEHPHRPVSALSRADRAVLARLLPAAGGVFGSEPFLTRDLFETDAAAVKVVTRGLNVRQVGRLFRRGEGQAIDGYMIQRDGAELNAILWRILKA
jgi:hypothetical protein